MAAYNSFDRIICVSETVRMDFLKQLPVSTNTDVLYNTNESKKILTLSCETVEPSLFPENEIKLVGVGKLLSSKGFHRLIPIVHQLREHGYPVHLYLLGTGPMKDELGTLAAVHDVRNAVTLLGYQTNPYKYVAKCDLFVCASYAEGFSTAATEALIVGTPVCTVEVSGMKEMLGENNEWGIVTDNNDGALFHGIKTLLDDPALLNHYRKKAAERGKTFSTQNTVQAVEQMLLSL
jgi:glycosyltransferase involved in cell wall biosynthesis